MAEKVTCSIVSGAPGSNLEFILKNIDRDSYIIAADSGYLKLSEIGIEPDLIVSDFDSSEKPEIHKECLEFPVEKAYTDTFNAVRTAVSRGFKKITVYGGLGGRFDHTYSNILCLDYVKKHGAECVIVDENQRISLICGKKVFKKDYNWFSVFAFLDDCKGIRYKGAHYSQDFFNTDSLDINQGDQIGQSNYVEDGECTVTVESGTLLLIESNDFE